MFKKIEINFVSCIYKFQKNPKGNPKNKKNPIKKNFMIFITNKYGYKPYIQRFLILANNFRFFRINVIFLLWEYIYRENRINTIKLII